MATPPTQERRGGQNAIDAAGATLEHVQVSERVLVYDFDHPQDPSLSVLGNAQALDLEVGFSVGDSGGGWFIQDDHSWKLVAIASGVLPVARAPQRRWEKYGALAAGARVSTINDWIDKTIGVVDGGGSGAEQTGEREPQ